MSASRTLIGHGQRLTMAVLMLAAAVMAVGMGLGRLEVTTLDRADETAQQARLARGLPARASAAYYDKLADIAVKQAEVDWAFVRDATWAALQREDRDTQIWGQLAFVEFSDPEGDVELGVEAFARSYALAGYGDVEFMMWRISFAAYIWDELDLDIRAAVLREARYAKRTNRAAFFRMMEEMRIQPAELLALTNPNKS